MCTSEVNSNHKIEFVSTGDVVNKAIQLFLDKSIDKNLTFHNLDEHMLELGTSCNSRYRNLGRLNTFSWCLNAVGGEMRLAQALLW